MPIQEIDQMYIPRRLYWKFFLFDNCTSPITINMNETKKKVWKCVFFFEICIPTYSTHQNLWIMDVKFILFDLRKMTSKYD